MPLKEDIMIAINQRRPERQYWAALLQRHPERPGFAPDRGAGGTVADWRDCPLELSGEATRVSGGSDLRLLAVLASATAALVHRCTEARHFTIGVPVPVQNNGADLINSFVPVGISMTRDDTFKDLTYRVRGALQDALANASFPVAAWAATQVRPEATLFDVGLSLDGVTEGHFLDVAGASTNFLFTRDGEQLRCRLRYDANRFRADSMVLLARRFALVLDRLCAAPLQSIATIDVMLPGERERWDAFNDTTAPLPQHLTLHGMLCAQAARQPDRVAVRYENRHLTYGELDRWSNRIAHVLQARGAGPETVVAITARRSLQTIPGLLGILKAGAAYLPLDPREPAARQRYKMQHSGVRLVLDHGADEPLSCEGFDRIDLADPALRDAPDHAPGVDAHPSSLAYVMYTSGSTGTPKGVAVPHLGVVNRLHWGQQRYPLTPDDVLLLKTSLLFDVSLYELFWWAWAGASVRILPPDAERDPRLLAETLLAQGITVVHFVPSMLLAWLETLRAAPALVPPQLRMVLASGEALQHDHAREFLRLFGNTGNPAPLVNLYGPTETSIEVSWFECAGSELPERIPIGRPISNVRLYVCDSSLRLCPPLVPGELYLGGACVTRGYVNDPASTAAAFVPDPFTGERMYRTGDLARLLPSGDIEFLGRLDHQLKIRGLRVDAGEIEHRLREYPGIAAAIVCPEQQQGETTLHAYLITGRPFELTVQKLRTWLSDSLPDYMIPAAFLTLPVLPLLSSGKADRKALAARAVPLASGLSHVEPRNDTEAEVAAIWRRTLGLQKVGIDDAFFEIGGSSLSVLKVLAGLTVKFGQDIPLPVLFEHTTIRGLGRWLDGEFAETDALAAVDSQAEESASMAAQNLRAFGAGNDV